MKRYRIRGMRGLPLALLLVGSFPACKSPAESGATPDQILAQLIKRRSSSNQSVLSAATAGEEAEYIGSAGNLDRFWVGTDEAIARMHLFIGDPVVRSRVPKITFEATVVPTSAVYEEMGTMNMYTARGERVTFTVKSGARILAKQQWATEFTGTGPSLGPFVDITGTRSWADIQHRQDAVNSGMLTKIIRGAGFSQEDLVKLSQSEVPEVRFVALQDIHDQAALANALIEENMRTVHLDFKHDTAREMFNKVASAEWNIYLDAAVSNLTNQDLLARVAIGAKDQYIRSIAIWRLTDQALLAKIADDIIDEEAPENSRIQAWLDSISASERLADLRANKH